MLEALRNTKPCATDTWILQELTALRAGRCECRERQTRKEEEQMSINSQSIRIGVVLSTGDLRGVFAHIGFLLALEELKVRYHAMAGSSAGAIVSSVVASGRTAQEAAERLEVLGLTEYWDKDSLLKTLYQLLIRKGRAYTGLVSANRLEDTLYGFLKAKTFEECPIPLYVAATNITKGVKEIFSSGEIAPAAVASAAIPVLFKAVRIGDSYYVDGGVFDLTPRSAICCREDLNVLIVNQIVDRDRELWDNKFMEQPWSIVTLVGRVIEAIYANDRFSGANGLGVCPCPCRSTVLTVVPRLDPLDRLKPWDGRHIQEQGYQETLRLLPPLMERITEKADGRAPLGRFVCEQDPDQQPGIMRERSRSG